MINRMLQGFFVLISLILLWQLIVFIFKLPPFILPTPLQAFAALLQNANLIFTQAIPTIVETLLGFLLAAFIGCSTAISMILFRPLRYWFLPLLLISQALPTFAIAPLFVIWFGYGMASKIATTVLMLFFPIASSFYDGLRRTPPGWLDLAKTMNAQTVKTLWHVRIPAALPALASGLRIAAAAAPIGAIIGEWVGSSNGLGFLMLNANARMQIDLMFAVLFVIVLFGIILYFTVDIILKKLIFWHY